MGVALTKKELASISGYTYRRLHDIDLALPKDEKLFVPSETNPKKFDLALFVQRWVDYNVSQVGGDSESEEYATIKAQHEKVKKEKTELEVARMKAEMVNIQDVHQLWCNLTGLVRNRFVRLGHKVGPALIMQEDAEKIADIIDREVRDALTLLANEPVPGGAETDADGDGDDEAGDEA